MVRFVLGSVAALLILAFGTALVGNRVAKQQALREARDRAEVLAQTVAAPLVDDGVRQGNDRAVRRVDAAAPERMRAGSIPHIKPLDLHGRRPWCEQAG